ncbi:MAG TPA: hypothetical protein VF909_07045, partial [Roseiflexaceae bacterium]
HLQETDFQRAARPATPVLWRAVQTASRQSAQGQPGARVQANSVPTMRRADYPAAHRPATAVLSVV